MANDYDVIIVGGGIGGLTAGLYLVRAGLRVLICEQRADPGGLLTATACSAGRLDVRLPCLCSQGVVFPVLAELDLDGRQLLRPADWQLAAPGLQIRLGHLPQVINELQHFFPRQAVALTEYGDLLHTAIHWLRNLFLPHPLLQTTAQRVGLIAGLLSKPVLAVKMARLLNTTVGNFLQQRFSDPVLIRFLGSLGYPRMPALLHAGMWYLFFEDYWLPYGGLFGFVQEFSRRFLAGGGTLLYNSEVDRILVRENRAYGVVLTDREIITAKYVIAAMDFNTTYKRLLREVALSGQFKRRLATRRPSEAYVTICLMTNLPAKQLQKLNTLHTFWFPADLPRGMIISAPGRQPSYLRPAEAEPVYLSCQDSGGQSPEMLQARMLRAAEELLPGVGQHASHVELWHPERYAREFGNFGGASAGWDLHPAHMLTRGFPGWSSPVGGLYHACQWVYSPGGMPSAMLSARQVSRKIIEMGNRE